MFDVLNKITVDAVMKPKNLGERELAAHHMLNVMQKDLDIEPLILRLVRIENDGKTQVLITQRYF